MYTTEVKFGPLLAAGTFLGLGLGGFLDSIIFQQILQTNTMLSARVIPDTLENIKINLYWNGIFQSFLWIMIISGVILIWNAGLNPYSPKSTKAFFGSILMGWGTYFAIEGIINHIIFKIHHQMEMNSAFQNLLFDVAFICMGLFFAIIGKILISRGKKNFYIVQLAESRWKEIKFKPAFVRQKNDYSNRAHTLP